MKDKILLSKDDELEYYRNRCNTLEQENKELHKEIAELKNTVSALVARNIKVKPNKSKNTQKKNNSKHPRKSRNRPTHIDDDITIDQKECNICGTKLSEPTHTYSRIVEDVLPAKAITTRYTNS